MVVFARSRNEKTAPGEARLWWIRQSVDSLKQHSASARR